MKNLLRNIGYHLFGFLLRRRYFHKAGLQQIEAAIRQSESGHGGEIAVVIETARPVVDILRKIPARLRAEHFFAIERIWDTEANCGVLIYILLSEHCVEIVADRGIAAAIPAEIWQEMITEIQPMLREHRGTAAVLHMIARIDVLLRQYFPRHKNDQNELKDQPKFV